MATGGRESASRPSQADGEQVPVYCERSFLILGLGNPFRRFMINLIQQTWFERSSMIVIAANCFALGSTDPCEVTCYTTFCQVVQLLELFIFLFFAVEMLIKMISMGVFGKGSYLSEAWNRLDCLIVVAGLMEYIFASNSDVNLSSIRALRVLRPLRAIRRISSLRLLVNLLLDILPMLGHVMILCLFIFFLFGTISVQLWSGVLRHRCFFPDSTLQPPAFMPAFYQKSQEDFVCSPSHFGMFHCSDIPKLEQHDGSMCTDLFGHSSSKLEICKQWVNNYTECVPAGPNPFHGTVNFDHIGYASVAIFQVISLEGWTKVMYLVQDSYSFWVWLYFIMLVLLGSYLAVNLCLVVIAAQFSVTKSREKMRVKKERLEAARLQGLSTASSLNLSTADSTEDESAGLYLQVLNLILHYGRLGCLWLASKVCRRHSAADAQNQAASESTPVTICEKCRLAPASSYRPLDKPLDFKKVSFDAADQTTVNRCRLCGDRLITARSPSSSRANSVDPPDSSNRPTTANVPAAGETRRWTPLENIRRFLHTSRAWLKRGLDSQLTNLVLQLFIFVNAIIMACEHHDQPVELTQLVEITNMVFTFVFLAELVAKLYAYGVEDFLREGFNVLDAVIILINLVELFSSGHGTGFAVLRLFRLVRIIKIVRFLPALQQQLLVMIRTVDNVTTFFLLLMFFLFISALLGMSLFGCRFCTVFRSMTEDNDNPGIVLRPVTAPGRCVYAVQTFDNDDTANLEHGDEVAGNNNTVQLLECPIANFDGLGNALFTVLQVFTQDDWGAIMKNAMHSTSDWAGLYFILLVTLGNYIIFNLLVAILVEGFSTKSEEAIMKASYKMSTDPTNKDNLPENNAVPEGHAEEKPKYLPGVVRRILKCFVRTKKTFLTVWNDEGAGKDKSLYLFKPDNWLRVRLNAIYTSHAYETILLVFILLSCAFIALENPMITKNSWERFFLTLANYITNSAFLCECIGKIVAFGLIFGSNAYLRNGWNILDFFLISIAVVDVTLDVLDPGSTSKKVLQVLRVLRLLRALRPLRMINKAHGLKIVIQTLAESIKPISNIILICCFFFLIFAILGVQLFRGCYARCVPAKQVPDGLNLTRDIFAKMAMETISTVSNKSECLSHGLEWETESYNFDSLPEALMSLFVFSTLDGWADITRNGVACVGVNQQPMPNYNPWNFLYFSAFLLIVCFFALNMFVGVVVNNFQKVQRRFETEMKARSEQLKKSGEDQILKRIARRVSVVTSAKLHSAGLTCGAATRPAKPKKKLFRQESIKDVYFWMDYPPWRVGLYQFVTHNTFELVMTAATAVNVVTMAVEFYNMPYELYMAFRVMGFIFLGLIVAETLLKFVALGFVHYWADGWNRLDLIILVVSIAATILEEIDTEQMPINPSIIRIARIFRIARVMKLWRAAAGVRTLLKTVSLAIPQVGHLSVLFFLLFFIYASLGVEMYGRFDCKYGECDGLSRHANFHNFGAALLTLFRIFTGDDWNGILKDILHLSSTKVACADEETDAEHGISCNIVHAISPFYFVSFVLLAQFVLINVVVAVLMRQIEDAHKESDDEPPALPRPPRVIVRRKSGGGSFMTKPEGTIEEVDEQADEMSPPQVTVIKIRRDSNSESFMRMKLEKIACGIEDDDENDDNFIIQVVLPTDAPAAAPESTRHEGEAPSEQAKQEQRGSDGEYEYVVVTNEQGTITITNDSSNDCVTTNCYYYDNNAIDVHYGAIEDTWRSMDNQLINRLAPNKNSNDVDSTMTTFVTKCLNNSSKYYVNLQRFVSSYKPQQQPQELQNGGQQTPTLHRTTSLSVITE